MHDTRIVMKDGTVHVGPMYDFRADEGWMSLIGTGPDRLYFRDMKTAVTSGCRVSIHEVADVDELKRARESGWDGG